jgi:hypothetical protein
MPNDPKTEGKAPAVGFKLRLDVHDMSDPKELATFRAQLDRAKAQAPEAVHPTLERLFAEATVLAKQYASDGAADLILNESGDGALSVLYQSDKRNVLHHVADAPPAPAAG